jgi:NADH:ubiquinone oxidoreductase subunit 3 (subunit A)
MPRPRARGPATRRAHCARRLGFDRNPLRRRTDRIEAAIRLATMILLLVAVPLAAIAVGRQADLLALRQAHAQRAAEHEVTAVLLRRAQATGVPDPYTSIQMTFVLARWQPASGPPRSGQVLAPAGAPAGSTVTVWIDASGAITSPPPDHRVIAGDVTIAATVTSMVAILLLLESNVLARRVLDRKRLSAWDADWRATGPLWSGRRG